MRVKITIEIERNGYTATETVEYIDRTPADITAEMAGQLQRLQAACNLRDRLKKVKKQPPDLTAGEFNRREC